MYRLSRSNCHWYGCGWFFSLSSCPYWSTRSFSRSLIPGVRSSLQNHRGICQRLGLVADDIPYAQDRETGQKRSDAFKRRQIRDHQCREYIPQLQRQADSFQCRIGLRREYGPDRGAVRQRRQIENSRADPEQQNSMNREDRKYFRTSTSTSSSNLAGFTVFLRESSVLTLSSGEFRSRRALEMCGFSPLKYKSTGLWCKTHFDQFWPKEVGDC
jgi:hypothetical protein